jgi:hypothetical protein
MHAPARSYWEKNRRTLNVIARKSGFVTGAAAMTGYHSVERMPASPRHRLRHRGFLTRSQTGSSPTARAVLDLNESKVFRDADMI